jgi:hypothetical protein
MLGAKYSGAIEGINEELNVLKGDPTANYTFSLLEFDSNHLGTRIHEHSWLVPVKNVTSVVGAGVGGGTPLYQATGETLERALKNIKPGEAVILTISTDGGENTSSGVYRENGVLRQTINLCQRIGYVVSFMGSERDIEKIISEAGISKGNTLSRQDTGDGHKFSYMASAASTLDYAQKFAGGQSVNSLSRGFFKEEEE